MRIPLTNPDYPAEPERVILFTIEAWDINCPQHIHQRIPAQKVRPVIEELQNRIQELEAKLQQYEKQAGAKA